MNYITLYPSTVRNDLGHHIPDSVRMVKLFENGSYIGFKFGNRKFVQVTIPVIVAGECSEGKNLYFKNRLDQFGDSIVHKSV